MTTVNFEQTSDFDKIGINDTDGGIFPKEYHFWTFRDIPDNWKEVLTPSKNIIATINVLKYEYDTGHGLGVVFCKFEIDNLKQKVDDTVNTGLWLIAYDGKTIRQIPYQSTPARHKIEIATYNYQNVTLQRKRKEYEQFSQIYEKYKNSIKGLIYDDVITAYRLFSTDPTNVKNHNISITKFSLRCKTKLLAVYRERVKGAKTPIDPPKLADKLKATSKAYTDIFGQITARKTP